MVDRDAWVRPPSTDDLRLVLLDRDGVLNRNLDGGVRSVAQWRWLPGAVRALRLLAESGRRVMVVTNQANVGRGIIGAADLDDIHRHMLGSAEVPRIDLGDILYCPHQQADGCPCRKPRPGLVTRALDLAGETPEHPLLIGDHESDLRAAAAARCWSLHVRSGRGCPPAVPVRGYLGDVPDVLAAVLALKGAGRLQLDLGAARAVHTGEDSTMTDFIQVHTAEWLEFFAERGYRGAEPLAAGVEGAIYRLGDGLVAKVWGRRQVPELVRMQNFYADVARAGLSFQTPEILEVEDVGGVAVTFDRELYGTPLQNHLAVEDEAVPNDVAEVLVQVLQGLSKVRATEHMRELPMLDETRPLWTGADTFGEALAQLVERRVSRFGHLLRAQVADFDRKHEAVVSKLTALETVALTVVHGDLFAENVLIDDEGRPSAVLDFGFLSTAGDPRLDAGITAVIVNMYGPHSRVIARQLTDLLCAELGYAPEVLLLYRAAYALATSNFLTSDGSDGHFEWCVGWLNDPQVTEVLHA